MQSLPSPKDSADQRSKKAALPVDGSVRRELKPHCHPVAEMIHYTDAGRSRSKDRLDPPCQIIYVVDGESLAYAPWHVSKRPCLGVGTLPTALHIGRGSPLELFEGAVLA